MTWFASLSRTLPAWLVTRFAPSKSLASSRWPMSSGKYNTSIAKHRRKLRLRNRRLKKMLKMISWNHNSRTYRTSLRALKSIVISKPLLISKANTSQCWSNLISALKALQKIWTLKNKGCKSSCSMIKLWRQIWRRSLRALKKQKSKRNREKLKIREILIESRINWSVKSTTGSSHQRPNQVHWA